MSSVILQELIDSLNNMNDKDYTRPLAILSNATIGRHVRHSIEMYQGLLSGYNESIVSYEKRKRDIVIESSVKHSVHCLGEILQEIQHEDKPIILHNEGKQYLSSYNRELLYCDEHSIHHMALIKIGLTELGNYSVKENFGIAPSTLQYRQSCAQ